MPLRFLNTGGGRALAGFCFGTDRWSRKYQSTAALWLRAREQVIPHFAVAPEIREIICTTNSIELLHAQLREICKARGHFPGDEAALKLS